MDHGSTRCFEVEPIRTAREARAARLSYLLLALAGAGCPHGAHATMIACGGAGQPSCPGYGGDLAIQPLAPSVVQGDPAIVDVGFESVTSLVGSYDITIDWDPTVLSFAGVSYFGYLDGPGNSIQSPPVLGVGTLELAETSLGDLSNQTGFGPLPLFEVTFNTLAAGITPIGFDLSAYGGPLIGDDLGASYTNFVTTDGSLQVTAPISVSVSEPDGLPLLAAGLLALAGAFSFAYRTRARAIARPRQSPHYRFSARTATLPGV